MSKFIVTHEKTKPKIEVLQIASETAKVELVDQAKLKLLYPTLLDYFEPYYYTKATGWAEVFDYIYFKQGLPKYQSSRFDCDDFAIWMKGLVAATFGLNYFGVVLGSSPLGYHAWNLFRDEIGLMQFEPQTGKYFPLGEQGYVAEYILV